MSPERLAKFLAVRPFRPFELHVGDGRALHVHHPEMVGQLEGGRTLPLTTPDDSSHLVDVFLVSGIEVPGFRNWDGAEEILLS